MKTNFRASFCLPLFDTSLQRIALLFAVTRKNLMKEQYLTLILRNAADNYDMHCIFAVHH